MARLFPGGGLPRPLPVDDQIDLRFTTIHPNAILDEDPRKKSRSEMAVNVEKTATCCHFLARWEHSLKRLKSQHGLALRLYKSRPMPRGIGMAFVAKRMQHRLASAEPGGTWLSRLCGTAEDEGTVRVG